MTFKVDGPVVLAGAGKMGGALLEGLLARGLAPADVIVQDPHLPPDVAALLAKRGVKAESHIEALRSPPSVILVAVKPQVMDQVFPPLSRLAGPNTLVLSIAAGRTIAGFEAHLAPGSAVVRAMPNTPAAIGRGITVCAANASVTEEQKDLCNSLLAAVGDVAWVDNEAMMDAVTAVSGSGPAYVFLLAECLASAGQAAGLDEATAKRLANATVAGAGELLHRSSLDAAVLRENVTSPGGTTAAALSVLMAAENGLEPLLARAVAAAVARSRELAR
ncbi:MAG: pyrroline-5-carboxylate reductase [Hyphomicrobium sp.]|jgi:pyrroline-5-carboxylate reductase